MPDWRKESGYRFPAKFPNYRWAWEFLRRNKEYRKEWTDTLSRIEAREGEFSKYPTVEELVDDSHVATMYMHCTDPDHPKFYIPIRAKHRWGLTSGLLNPNTDEPERLSFIGLGMVHIFTENTDHRLSPAGLRFPWAVFDFALPLRPQMKAVLVTLEREQKRSKFKPRHVKHHCEMWPLYLRLLDADLDDRTPKQIANALQGEMDGPDEKTIWAQLKKARSMTLPSGYLSIFRSSSEIYTP